MIRPNYLENDETSASYENFEKLYFIKFTSNEMYFCFNKHFLYYRFNFKQLESTKKNLKIKLSTKIFKATFISLIIKLEFNILLIFLLGKFLNSINLYHVP